VIAAEWLLVHECLIRQLIDCPSLEQGFDAARQLVALDKLEALETAAAIVVPAPASADGADEGLKTVIAAVEQALEAYESLRSANLAKLSFGRWVYWRALLTFSEIIADAFESLKAEWDQLGTDDRTRSAVAAAITRFEQNIGNVDNAFLPVNVAVNALVTAGTAVAYGPFALFILPMALAADSVGADILPDDANLERKSELMILQMKAILRTEAATAELALPATPTAGDDEETQADMAAVERERLLEQRRLDRAEAQTKFEALQAYVRERKLFFHQVIWSHHDNSWIESKLRERSIPPQLFELRFAAFEGHCGALRLINLALAQQMGFDFQSLRRWQHELAELSPDATEVYETFAPAPGVVVEPLIGKCAGGDSFVEAHRALDVERATAEVRKLKAEAELAEKEVARLSARLERDMLDDPTPNEGSGTVVVRPPEDND
jgi:hypothetical protein